MKKLMNDEDKKHISRDATVEDIVNFEIGEKVVIPIADRCNWNVVLVNYTVSQINRETGVIWLTPDKSK